MSTRPDTPLPPQIGRTALRALAAAGITQMDQLARVTDRDPLALHGVDPKAVRILRSALDEGDAASE